MLEQPRSKFHVECELPVSLIKQPSLRTVCKWSDTGEWDQNLTIAGDRAGGVPDGGRGAGCFRAGLAGWAMEFGTSLSAEVSVTGSEGIGEGGSTIDRKPTTNVGDWPGAASGWDVSGDVAVWSGNTGWPPTARKPTASCGAGAGIGAAVAVRVGSAGGLGGCAASTEPDVRSRAFSQ